jgi:vacuolar-type H+-ATPase subunit E/Vma4
MALRELVLALERDAEARLAAVRAEARAAASQLRAEASTQLARRRSMDLATRAAELDTVAREAIDAARRGAASRSLAARAEALDAILASARARLATVVPDATLQRGIQRDAAAALEYLGETAAVVRCPPAWGPALRQSLAGRPGVRLEESDEVGAGMIVLASDRHIEIDATLDARLTRLWPALAIELLRAVESPA